MSVELTQEEARLLLKILETITLNGPPRDLRAALVLLDSIAAKLSEGLDAVGG